MRLKGPFFDTKVLGSQNKKDKGQFYRWRGASSRIITIFFLTLFVLSMLTPTASAIVATSQLNAALSKDSHTPAVDGTTTKEHTLSYPQGAQATTAKDPAAVDAQAPVSASSGLVSELGKNGTGALQKGEALQGVVKSAAIQPHELTDKRTAKSSLQVNKDGSITEKDYFNSQFYKKDGKWATIDNTLTEDKNAGDSGNVFGKALGQVESLLSSPTNFTTVENGWQTRFSPSNASQGMVRIKQGNSQIAYTPVNAKDVAPVITKNDNGQQVVHYYDLWPGINVEYVVTSDAVKENIVIKDKSAVTNVAFKVSGATLEQQKDGFAIKGALGDQFTVANPNLVLNNFGPETSNVLSQNYKDGVLTTAIDQGYLQSLPDKAFPAVIDPSTFSSNFGTRAGGSYVSLKSDGYVCSSDVCNPYAGSLYDTNNVLRYWRSAVFASYDQFKDSGKVLTAATLHLQQRTNAGFWTGTTDAHTYYVGHATCEDNFSCLEGGSFNDSGSIATSGNIDVTDIYQAMISRGDFSAWLLLGGEDGTYSSFKNFDPGTGGTSGSYVSFTYGGQPPAPSIAAPIQNQVYVDPQPSFSVNAITPNPNGSTPLQYEIMVSSGAAATGTLITSGKQNSLQWTVPDGILQDGSTYYVQARSYDPITGTYSSWGTSVPFRIDMRTGGDKSQTYDTLGPISADLATGNVSTSNSSHSSTALGGSLGVSLDYNSPLRSRNGLVGQYWDNDSFTGDPLVTRVDQNVDFNWDTGSPSSGVIDSDTFSVRWQGYFIAPQTGSYQFGSDVDDGCKIWANSQLVVDNWTWCGGQYGTSISLTAGQIIPIRMDYREIGGSAVARLKVKGIVSTDGMVVPSDWLQTGVRPLTTNQHGLNGNYYARLDGTNTFSSYNPLVMKRVDPYLDFDWGTSAPVSGGPSDFLVRWTGYITAPVTGTYTFGSRSDDGTKITVGTSNTVALNDWTDHTTPSSPVWGSNTISLNQGMPTPITIEYYDSGSAASFEFWVKSSSLAQQIVPTSWLSPNAQVLPSGWSLGTQAGSSANYDHLTANQNSVVLSDSSGATHEYTWTGSGYKPPVNEDGNLTRNSDGTFTFQDVDGQTYVFNSDGTIASLTSAADDRNPTALQYQYQSQDTGQTGGPVHLYKIKDAVDPTRTATLYYGGDSGCGAAPTGFDATPTGMLCAVTTNDGRTTNFYYIAGQLARVQQPGNQMTDYNYEAVLNSSGQTVGYRLNSVRDSLAMDTVAAGERSADSTTATTLSYDILGRVTSVTQPAPTAGAAQAQATIEYLPGAKGYQDSNGAMVPGYAGMTKEHIVGGSEPNGFSRRLKYDSLYRTIEDTDITNQSVTTEWDPQKDLVYSTTNALGLKTTTVYDDEDRPVSSYGAAPASWFDTSNPKKQVPLAAYASQVARNDVSYDGGITGLSVAYMSADTKAIANTMASGAQLNQGQSLYSLDRRFQFFYQNDGNVVLYGPAGAMWSSGTTGQVSNKLALQSDGNLVLYNGTTAIWASNTSGKGSSTLTVQNDGNTVLSNSAGSTWATNTGGQPTWGKTYAPALTGAPLKHATNFASDGTISKDFGTATPTGYSNNWGLSFSGKMRLPQTGAYNFRFYSDGGLRMWVDDKLVVDDWNDDTTVARNHTGTFTETTANTVHRVVIAYFHTGKTGASAYFHSYITPPGGSETSQIATYFSPDYNLPTSATSYDSTIGNTATTTSYGSNPELSQAQSSTIDPTGLNLTSTTSYETQGAAGSYLRPTSVVSPGNTTSNPTRSYTYYGATETRDNPCTTGTTEAYKQAGMLKTMTNASPDGGTTAGITTENIYDDAGRTVATRSGSDPWTCTTYDSRGRTSTVTIPAYNGEAARTVSNDYAVGGDPLETTTWDGNGWVVQWTDLLGRVVKYRDVHDDETTTTYDQFGKITQRVSPVGTETFDYDTYNRLTNQKLDGTIYATVYYDAYSRIDHVSYPAAGQMKTTPGYDSMLRNNSVTYTLGDGTTSISDTATLSQSNRVLTDNVVSGSSSLASSYTYDKAGRLTGATTGPHTFSYGYGAQNTTTCGTGANMNANSGKNGNRTTQTIDGVMTNYCYDYADKLVNGTGNALGSITYDSHGNMTHIGTPTATSSETYLYYDSSDRNIGMEQYDINGQGSAVYYDRDVAGRIVGRYGDSVANWAFTGRGDLFYGYTGSGSSFIRDANWNITEKTLQLPGDVMVSLKPQQTGNAQKQYTLPSYLGRTLLTVDAAGTNTSTSNGPLGSFAYDPFGNVLAGGTNPSNTVNGSYGFGGTNQKVTETTMTLQPIQMGARVYLPTIGRFTSIDPVLGGNANNYVYSLDPVNGQDYTGMFNGAIGILSGGGGLVVGTITGSMQNGANPQSGATNTIQVTSNGSQLQYGATPSNYGHVSLPVTRAAAKPAVKTKDNSTAMAAAHVTSIFISRVQWDGNTLRVYPTPFGRYDPDILYGGLYAWKEVIARAPTANTMSMKAQFFCHWDFVRVAESRKESWNLDAQRPYTNYGDVYRQKCNINP